MNNPDRKDDNDLIAKGLRGHLTGPERADLDRRLQADDSFRESYDTERSLDHLLERLPNVPVSTNFTSLVMQAARSESKQRRPSGLPWLRLSFSRLAAGLAVFAVAGGLTVHQYRSVQRQEMVRSLESFTEVATTMSPEQRPGLVFQDFETIQKYPIPSDNELDMELLVALQK